MVFLACCDESQMLSNVLSFFYGFPPKDRFVLAISGGMDSMTLLHILSKADSGLISRMCVAHLHHGIRKESDLELRSVSSISQRYGFQFYGEKRDIPGSLKSIYKGRGIEDAAREERKRFYQSIKEKWKAQYIVTAHQKDDLLETFLMRLLRGTGLVGYEGMKPKDGAYLRPLLGYWKEEIAEYAREKKIEYYEDSTNKDDRFLRNRVRNQLVPFLSERFGFSVKDVLVRDQQILSASSALFESFMAPLLKEVQIGERHAVISWKSIAPCSDDLLKEVLVRIMKKWKGNTCGIDSEKLIEIVKRFRKPGNYLITLNKRFCFFREYEDCGFSSNYTGIQRFRETDRVFIWEDPANAMVVDLNDAETLTFYSEDVAKPESQSLVEAEKNGIAYFDKDRIQFPLYIRFARPGDVFIPLGAKYPKKVARFCIDQKIPYRKRRDLLLLLDRKNDIIWCIGIRIADSVRITRDTRRFVKIEQRSSFLKELEGRERNTPQSFDGKK